MGARPRPTSAGRRMLPRLSLFWQWCLMFVSAVAILHHYRFAQRQDGSFEEDLPSSRDRLSLRSGLPLRASSPPPLAVPQRQCPVANPVPWGTMPRDPAKNRAAVYTPYNIVFGGGERYLLTVVQVMQEMGYLVDVLVRTHNLCSSTDQLLRVASGLRVQLKPDMVALRQVEVKGTHIQAPQEGYSLFMLLGNEKLPTFAGIGHVNFYMCQFPFDLNRAPLPGTTKALSTYDYVLLNSEYTDRWYNQAVRTHLEAALHMRGAGPQVVVLHPPVEPFPAKSQLLVEGPDGEKVEPRREHIMLLGRFFRGRQSKGHYAAIEIFESVLPSLPPNTQLHLVGNMMPGHKEYVDKLRQRAGRLPVHFHIGVTPQKIEEVMHSSLVQWHLTGIGLEVAEDPASEEHFGISIAEGMSAGVIPVVLNRGGVTDIVRHGVTGYLAQSAQEIGETTKEVFGMGAALLAQLRSNAISWVERFSTKSFAKNFRVLANRGLLTKPFRHLIQHTGDIVYPRSFNLPAKSTKAALIIEARQHYAFEYVVKNVMYHLGEEWSLIVYHGKSNAAFVRDVLASVSNVKYRELDTHQLPVASLNALLKAPEFWGELQGVQRVLFFQTDSVLVHGGVGEFLQYDYVGAPWHRKNERWRLTRDAMPQGVGNGGLSLRSVPAMLELTRAHGNTSGAQQEDFVWSAVMEREGERYRLAPRDAAYRFCVEVPCEDLEKGRQPGGPAQTLPALPMALHASWYYFWGHAKRFADLLMLLETSVCGPVQGAAIGSTASNLTSGAAATA
ncbi:hypothetical protein ABPG75_011822 [Micractinium tetrahymenae]